MKWILSLLMFVMPFTLILIAVSTVETKFEIVLIYIISSMWLHGYIIERTFRKKYTKINKTILLGVTTAYFLAPILIPFEIVLYILQEIKDIKGNKL